MKKLYNFINFGIFFGVIYQISAQAIVIDKLSITNKLGIGVDTPLYPLDVRGASYGIMHSNGEVTLGSYIGSTPNGEAGWLGTKSTHPLHFYTNDSNPYMTIGINGNIGIHTETPNAPLQFSNSLQNRKAVFFDEGNNDHQFIGLGANNGLFRYQINSTASHHVFYAGVDANNSNELMRIAGNGAVSIGTNNNTAQLSIADNKFTNGLLIDALNTPGGNALKVIGTANITGNTNLDNNLIVEGATDIGGTTTIGGNLSVSGTLSKGSGTFKIDHPMDPENKYLYHSFIESPDMMNIYNGNIITNKEGIAKVVLPSYFEGLNSDFRYQLTVIGTFAQAIIAEKVKNNQFIIKTNIPNVEVSWMVTGIRKDAFANKNRVKVEVEKSSDEKGSYLHPEAFGWGEEKSISKKKNKIQ
ncbi:MAG: hypothetical protein V4683_13730 [Bacteroidota bacterium]